MGSGKSVCRRCGDRGHMTKTCQLSAVRCRRCGILGHATEACEQPVAHCEVCALPMAIKARSSWVVTQKRGMQEADVKRVG